MAFEHVIPQGHPGDAARQPIADFMQMAQEILPASVVEREQPVAGSFAVRENVVRQRQILDPRHFRGGTVDLQ